LGWIFQTEAKAPDPMFFSRTKLPIYDPARMGDIGRYIDRTVGFLAIGRFCLRSQEILMAFSTNGWWEKHLVMYHV
jgi:hypothetical protein